MLSGVEPSASDGKFVGVDDNRSEGACDIPTEGRSLTATLGILLGAGVGKGDGGITGGASALLFSTLITATKNRSRTSVSTDKQTLSFLQRRRLTFERFIRLQTKKKVISASADPLESNASYRLDQL